jgi:hypothetical protein
MLMLNGVLFQVGECEGCKEEQPIAYNHHTLDWSCWFCCEKRDDVQALPDFQRDQLQGWYTQAARIFHKYGHDAAGQIYDNPIGPMAHIFWDRAQQAAGPVDIDAGYEDDEEDAMPRPARIIKQKPVEKSIPGWVYNKDETSNITQDVSDEAMSFLERALEGMPDTTKYVLGKLGEST